MRRSIISLSLLLIGFYNITWAQGSFTPDTLRLTLAEAEKMFLAGNLSLLAEKCNVDAARAQIIQAKLYNNPNISIEQGVYDPGTKKVFDMGYSGNTGYTLQQLFYLAGKRNKRIRLEQINTQRQEYLFYDLLRTLKFQLRSDFNTIYYKQQTFRVYDKEISSLKKLISVFEEQNRKGFISDKELTRLQASLFSLENEKSEISNSIAEMNNDFSILLQMPGVYFVTIMETASTPVNIDSFKVQALVDTAMENRFDLKAADQYYRWNEANLAYQKALAVPDLTLQTDYSKQGSYVRNYNAVTLAIDLPFFNQNQGNIKAAKFQADNSKYILQSAADNVKGDVMQAYTKIIQNEQLYHSFDSHFYGNFEKLMEEMTRNYENKNISLLEFLDFYEAYKDNQVQLNAFLNNRLNTFEELNFSVGENIINY